MSSHGECAGPRGGMLRITFVLCKGAHARCALALQAAVTKLRNDAVVVPLSQQGPLNASGAAQQGADEGLQLSSMNPDLAEAAVAADSKAAKSKGVAEAGSEGGKGTGETDWMPGKNPKGMRIEDAFRESAPASMGLRGSGQVCWVASKVSYEKSSPFRRDARAGVLCAACHPCNSGLVM